MFDVFFGIACETKILEACYWDEERAEFLMSFLSSILEESMELKSPSPEKVIQSIRDKLEDSASEYEIEALVEIINDSIENMPFLLTEDQVYEN